MPRRWSEAEDAIIRDNLDKPSPVLSDLISKAGQRRSPASILERRQRLDLRRQLEPGTWTEVRIELVRKLYIVEGKSAAVCAHILGGGISRNAVIGIVHRQGWDRAGASTPKRAAKVHMVRHVRPSKPKPEPKGMADASIIALTAPNWREPPMPGSGPRITGPVEGSLNLSITDPGFRHFGCCKWPTAEDGDPPTFCCLPTSGIYCTAHALKGFHPMPSRGRNSASELTRSLRRYL